MKRGWFKEEHFIGILKQRQAELGAKEFCRKYVVIEATFNNLGSKYSGTEVSDAKELEALEAKNAKLKELLAKQVTDMPRPKEMLENILVPESLRNSATYALKEKQCNQKQTDALARVNPRVCRHVSKRSAHIDLRG